MMVFGCPTVARLLKKNSSGPQKLGKMRLFKKKDSSSAKEVAGEENH